MSLGRNAKRKKREFARCFYSKERVEFVKTLGCSITGWTLGEPIDNAHTGKHSGAGRRADFDTIVPFARSIHQEFDAGRDRFCEKHNFDPEKRAAEVQTAWEDWG